MNEPTETVKRKRHYTGTRKRERRNADGSKAIYWEGRIVVRDSLGRVRRKSVYGKTVEEVRAKMHAEQGKKIASFDALNETAGDFLDRWLETRRGQCQRQSVAHVDSSWHPRRSMRCACIKEHSDRSQTGSFPMRPVGHATRIRSDAAFTNS